LAAAVRDADGRPAAALNVAMAAAEVSLSELVDAVAPAVVEAAANISRHLGLSGAAAAGDSQQRAEAVAR
jgi:DNA-binding IclR family transcriptional regulator